MAKLEIHQFPVPLRQLRRADPRCRRRRHGRHRCARRQGGRRRAEGQGLAAHAHPDHAPPRRPHRRQPGAQGRDQVHASSARARRPPRFRASTRRSARATPSSSASHEVRVFDTPGHTAGHITYWIPSASVAFVGDTLFAIGCGRVIEGNAQMMWQSLREADGAAQGDASSTAGTSTRRPTPTSRSPSSRRTRPCRSAPRRSISCAPPASRRCRPPSASSSRPIRSCARTWPAIQQRLGMVGKPEWQIFGEIRERKNRG